MFPMKRDTSASAGGQSVADARLSFVRFMGVFIVLSVLFWVAVVVTDPPSGARNLYLKLQKAIADEKEVAEPIEVGKDKWHDNLLPIGFDEKSCLSRFESAQYRRGTQRKASPYLLSKLRSYEARHKKCGVYTESYNKTVQLLKYGGTFTFNSTTTYQQADCRYIVWISFEGLGNKMLTLASAFLYALLTDRVVLADRGVDIPDLFCEPFPQVSWFLPLDFPLTHQFNFNKESNRSYGNLVGKTNSSQPYVSLYLAHDFDGEHRRFFCDEDQTYLHNIPWLIMKSDVYVLPFFFLIPSFQQELNNLFPDKETVFHLLGRYLFHPTNAVWDLITRFHQTYLSKADEIVGIQVRVFENNTFTYDQIMSCTMRENILPQVREFNSSTTTTSNTNNNNNTVAILIASLISSYFEQVRDFYYENQTMKGEVVGVFQPSNEGHQQTQKHDHNRKALAEIYLLSFSDKLVTSGWSTFGYVAQSLGGLKPWILNRAFNGTQHDPPCGRAMSIEPCFHNPPYYNCKSKRWTDPGVILPHVRHCEDIWWGLKLF